MIYSLTREEFIAWMERIMDRFDQLNSSLERKEKLKNCLDGEVLMDNQDVCLLLKISIRSLQYYRSSGKLPFHKISGKVYYKSSDVHEFIRKSFEEDSSTTAKPVDVDEQSSQSIRHLLFQLLKFRISTCKYRFFYCFIKLKFYFCKKVEF